MTNDNKIQILITENNKIQADKLRFLLEDAGYQTNIASNGKEALDILKTADVNIVLTDIIMPEMDGYTLCKMIKNNPTTSEIPVILLTQLANPVDVIRGLECEADNFIIKPYNDQALLSYIKDILANRSYKENLMQVGIEVVFHGKKYYIASNRMQILNILFSTNEIAVKCNRELADSQERLAEANIQLSLVNKQLSEMNTRLLTANNSLQKEISEREVVQKALSIK